MGHNVYIFMFYFQFTYAIRHGISVLEAIYSWIVYFALFCLFVFFTLKISIF